MLVRSYSFISGAMSDDSQTNKSGNCLLAISRTACSCAESMYELMKATATDSTPAATSFIRASRTCASSKGGDDGAAHVNAFGDLLP